jgi:putative spermidine/putrescine transport system permease protein
MTAADRLLTIYVAIVSALVIAPIAVVLIVALNTSNFLSFPPAGLSFRWFAQVTSEPMNNAVSSALQTFFLSPLMLPTVVIGLALMQFYNTLEAPASLLTVTLGQLLIAVPYVIRLVLASFAGVDLKVERAAAILGANPAQVFWRVTFPLIRHAALAGALFSFIVSLDDVNIALFLSDVRTTPLPVQLFSYIEQNADSIGAAAASILVLLACVTVFICDRLVGIEWLFGIEPRSR